jgi:tetratricopeptide (TPR) repeat protein
MMRFAPALVSALLLSVGAASAQTVVSMGVGLAHDCFIRAKAGTDPRDGVDVCSQAINREPLSQKDLAATFDNRGVMLDRLERTQQAAADFRRAMDLDASLGDPYVNLGSMLIKEKRYDDALARINQGIALGVSFPQIGYYNRAVAYHQMGKFKEAYFDYKKALEIDPSFAMAAEHLKDFVVTRAPAPGAASN